MPDLYKFGWLPDNTNEQPYEYPNIWSVEKTTGPDRLVIAPKSRYIGLLLDLAKSLDAPYGLLYVLTLPRGGGTAGRYQHPSQLSFDEIELFLYSYQELLEQDARNSIWVQSSSGLLVYDRHNVIYAYGPWMHSKQPCPKKVSKSSKKFDFRRHTRIVITSSMTTPKQIFFVKWIGSYLLLGQAMRIPMMPRLIWQFADQSMA